MYKFQGVVEKHNKLFSLSNEGSGADHINELMDGAKIIKVLPNMETESAVKII